MNTIHDSKKIGNKGMKLTSILLAVLMAFSMMITAIPVSASAAENSTVVSQDGELGKYKVTLTTGNLILRSIASTNGDQLALVPNGTIVDVTEISNGFGKTSYNGKVGWLYMGYLTKVADSAEDEYMVGEYVVITDGGNLILRAEPSGSGKQLTTVPNYTDVYVTEITNGYGKTTYNGQTGWLSMQYLSKTVIIHPSYEDGLYLISVGAGSNLVMRDTASSSGKQVTLVPDGKYVTVTETKDGYGKITYSGYTGWISMAYVVSADTHIAPGEPSTPGTYYVATEEGNLILRDTNGTEGKILDLIPRGSTVVISEVNNGWGRTTFNGKSGWVSMNYLRVKSSDVVEDDNSETTIGVYKVTTNGGNLVLRDAPSASGKQVALVPNGTLVTITELQNGYGKTTYNGQTGWLALSYLIAYSGSADDDTSLYKVPGSYQVTVSSGNLILRDSSENGTMIDSIPKGTILYVTEVKNGYGKVTYNGKTGWVSMNYLTYVSDSQSTDSNPVTGQTGTYIITTNGSGLNLRAEPNPAARVYFSIPNGTKIVITDVVNGYGKTTYNGQTGWISMSYLVYVSDDGSVSEDLQPGEYRVATSSGNLILRSEPSSASEILTSIPSGTVLTITEFKDGYGKTTYNGLTGWVSANYLVKAGDVVGPIVTNGRYQVTTKDPNSALILREEPSASSRRLDIVPNGAIVTITEVYNGFGKTTYNGQTGWLSLLYLTALEDGDNRIGSYQVTTAETNLVLREKPSTDSLKLTSIPKGTIIYISEVKDGWGKTRYNGLDGWVAMNYLTFVSDSDIATDTGSGESNNPGNYTVTTNGGNLILRDAPSASGKQLALIPNGTVLTITEIKDGYGKTRYNGIDGWVSMSYLRAGGSTGDDKGYALGNYKVVLSSGNLNLREEPNVSARVIESIPNGTALVITEVRNGWGKTTYNGKTGWVSMAYLVFVPSDDNSDNEINGGSDGEISDELTLPYVVDENYCDSLAVYESASTESEKVGTINALEVVYLHKVSGDWGYISYEDEDGNVISGWVRMDMLTNLYVYNGSTEGASKGAVMYVLTLDEDGVINLHEEKSIFSKVLTRIPNGKLLYVQEIDGAWAKVTYNGKTGWILHTFLTTGDTKAIKDAIDDYLRNHPNEEIDYEKLLNDILDKLGLNDKENENTDNEIEKDSNLDNDIIKDPNDGELDSDNTNNGSDDDTVSPETHVLYGDVDVNGKVNMEDVVLFQRVVAKLDDFKAQGFKNADVNGDGVRNMEDIVLIQQYIAELIKHFPVEE